MNSQEQQTIVEYPEKVPLNIDTI